MNNSHNNSTSNDDMLITIMFFIGSIIGLFVCWNFFHSYISYYSLKWAWSLLYYVKSIPPFDIVRKELFIAAKNPSGLSFYDLMILNIKGYFILSPLLFIVAIPEILGVLNNPNRFTKRAMTIEKLRKTMNAHSTATIPMDHWPNLLENDPEEHRSALSPIEFAKENNLINRRNFDEKKATIVFEKQLGEKFTSFDDLSRLQKTIFSIFATQICESRIQCQVLIDDLNRSCGEKENKGYPNLDISSTNFEKHRHSDKLKELAKQHKYVNTLLLEMHTIALKRGKLPSSNIRWLKGLDRILWYTINNTGRKVAWVECAGIYTQHQWEKFIYSKKGELCIPHVKPAVESLGLWLEKNGFVSGKI